MRTTVVNILGDTKGHIVKVPAWISDPDYSESHSSSPQIVCGPCWARKTMDSSMCDSNEARVVPIQAGCSILEP